MATLVAAKEKMFITQTKLLYEVTWKTVEQITKKHVVSSNQILKFCYVFINNVIYLFLIRNCLLIYINIYVHIMYINALFKI